MLTTEFCHRPTDNFSLFELQMSSEPSTRKWCYLISIDAFVILFATKDIRLWGPLVIWLRFKKFGPNIMFDVGFYPFTIWLKCNTTLIRGSELLISNNTFLADGSIVAYNIRLGSIEAVWMLGVIDEIQMPMKETDRNPILVDKKKCKPLHRNDRLYKFQKDQSLLGEEKFAYDYDLFKSQIKVCLELWKVEQEASFTPVEDRWKCCYCQFEFVCPAVLKLEITPIPSQADSDNTPS
ncbi:hypothetical protein CUMW_100310 [Citrus unshiu]|nr:hypothetical protein CUMW_100310 [Citrus unshiu]